MLQLGEHLQYKNEKCLDTCNKGNIVFVFESNKKRADFKTGIIGDFKPYQDGKKQMAVAKCMIKGRIATLTRGYSSILDGLRCPTKIEIYKRKE